MPVNRVANSIIEVPRVTPQMPFITNVNSLKSTHYDYLEIDQDEEELKLADAIC